MNRITLVKPSLEHKDLILDYKREFIVSGDSIDGSAGLQKAKTYEEWHKTVEENQKEETVRDGFVPATTFMALSTESSQLVGMIDIRHRLNESLLNVGGHIGYSVRKTLRKQGYATEMLKLALLECSTLGIKKVLITCNKDNLASAKTIVNNGGTLENEVVNGDVMIQRYWIELN